MPKVTEAYLETRRQHILDAAITCFARKGFHQTTMEEIGQEAGLSPGVAYRYFENKEDIILATIQDSLDRAGHLFESDEGDTLRVLEQMLDDHLQRVQQPGRDKYYKVRVQLWAEVIQNPEVAEKARLIRQTALKQLAKVIKRGQEKGQINPDLDPMAVSLTISAIHDGVIIHWLADPNLDFRQHREVFMAMMRGLIDNQR
jgi:AcrR family transcriptional regulator